MTTFSQLSKYAEPEFPAGMRARGFKTYKGWMFERTNGLGISLILTFDIQSKVRLRMYPYMWIPELNANDPELIFPDGAMRDASFPSYQFAEWPSSWPIETETEARRSLSEILLKLDNFVIPWADKIDDGSALVKRLEECYILDDPAIRAQVPRIVEKYKK